jgi:lipoprotein-anchoring transpeptidase ErfK/SrfK
MQRIDRRLFLVGAPLLLAGCGRSLPNLSLSLPDFGGDYGVRRDNGHLVAAVDTMQVPSQYRRQTVAYQGAQRPGTIVIDPGERFLYLIQGADTAVRYGVGVGREGFAWSGTAQVRRKAVWPSWTPPVAMQERQPEAARFAAGMPGGPDNPLGARALYLYQGGHDTLYRIHGTNEPSSIGHSMSSGCIRLLNQDIIDLYNRVPIGTKVVVLPVEAGMV